MPALKKPNELRRRGNHASTRAVLRAPTGDVKVPPLPERDQGWHALTVAWWADIWASPMSPEWHHSDLHALYALAAVYDDIWRASSATARKEAASEYRLARKDFGLTPYDRRRLEWTIEPDVTPRRTATSPAATSRRKPAKADPRELLRSVS